MKKIFTVLSLIITVTALSCNFGVKEVFYRNEPINKRAVSVKLLQDEGTQNLIAALNAETDKIYSILIITDIHFGRFRPDRNDDLLISWIGSLSEKPKFCICLGDIADHGKENEFKDYNRLEQRIKDAGIQYVYNILGNHDLYNSGWRFYEQYCYPNTSCYYFSTDRFSFYFLDTASGSLGKKQMADLKTKLAADPKPKIVSSHYPIYANCDPFTGYFSLQDTKESDTLISLCVKNNVKLFLDGHTHRYFKNQMKGFLEFNVPSELCTNQWALITVNENDGTIQAAELINGND